MTSLAPAHYDLLTESWIPCERPDGSRALVGIERALTEAHTFAALHDESPLTTATLHRLLLAVLQRVFMPRNLDDWLALWEAPAFDAARVREYLARFKERFDLFHPVRPFLQVANLREVLLKERGKEAEATEAFRLSVERSRYARATNLFEAFPAAPAVDPAQAARSLLGFLAFTPGGRIQNEAESWKAGSLRGGAVLLLRGETLHRTLLSNLIWDTRRDPNDVPPWERREPTRRTSRAPHGPVDLLVWPSRRVELLATRDESGTISIREVVTAAGERFDADVPDPMFGYVVRDLKKPPLAIRIEVSRSVWRDATALFDAATGKDAFRRPAACTQLAELVRIGAVPRGARFQVEIFGLASDQAAIDLWRADRMPLPSPLLNDGARISALREALTLAEDLGRSIDYEVLGTLAGNALAPGAREAHKEDIGNLKKASGAMPAYWGTLGQAFPVWLDGLGISDDLDGHVASWKGTLRTTAREVVMKAADWLGTGARALQARAKSEQGLHRVLRRVLGANPDGNVTLPSGSAARPQSTTEGFST
jgi:CRISPR system Cascade subunit CasA